MSKPYPYRFKTETEFIDEFGTYWPDHIENGWDWDGMDYLLGKDYEFYIDEYIMIIDLPDVIYNQYDTWAVSWDMLIKNEKIPTYKPRRRK